MKCPLCGSDNFGVVDSRDQSGLLTRKRRCKNCGHGWFTVEIDQEEYQKMKGKVKAKMTNGDAVRLALNRHGLPLADRVLAHILSHGHICPEGRDGEMCEERGSCFSCWMRWIKEERNETDS